MAGGRIQFTIANESHDAGMRQLLKQVSMPGGIRITLQREPSYFAAAKHEGPEHHAVVATLDGQVVAMGSVSIRSRFVNGVASQVGYLGGLRLHPSVQGRFDIIRRGYELLHEICRGHGQMEIFTTIAADNHRAIRLLSQNVPGMPAYTSAGDLVTLLIRIKRGRSQQKESTTHGCDRQLLGSLNTAMSQFQFAPCWSADELVGREFIVLGDGNNIDACGALWDQRSFKQPVVHAYPWHLKPLAMLGLLPPVGRTIPQAFISPLACPQDRPGLLLQLINRLAHRAAGSDIKMLCIGFDARDPRIAAIQKQYSTHIYRTRLYRVAWPTDSSAGRPLDGQLLYPEVALL